ncbi:histone deacetylase family protein [Acidisoma cellulosilytica]|uniref:Histone deacetylase family protein n=1 Tax=Acidisoma cellulosilyticum TaxID=2802395 RepID=A0A964E2K1_9PROT|nr:histone deacetylase family protein [Acidisoma cellulosilyticum]MCB8879705.1 histone deacetylase family protein [Acidisoma cellulosilyticum]
MDIIFSPDHALHQSPGELNSGEFVPAFEKPERAEIILSRAKAVDLGPVIAPDPFPAEHLTRIHDPRMLDLLRTGAAEWAAQGRQGGAFPFTFFTRGFRADRVPQTLEGRLAWFCFDAGTPLTATSWQAIESSAHVALTGAAAIAQGKRSIFSLCRPPGHHAGSDHYGGYCFINNVAVAAQYLLDQGAKRVAILDVDYHHGNGTQQIFYQRNDVLLVNIHATPDQEYPYLLGFADEPGAGAGEGFNLNLPLPWGTDWAGWSAALEAGCQRVAEYAPDVLLISLGVDTYIKDPISQFKLDHAHFTLMGERIAKLGLPTQFIMEGGYAVAEIGVNAVNVLTGFEGR